jgi:hypothetical protein
MGYVYPEICIPLKHEGFFHSIGIVPPFVYREEGLSLLYRPGRAKIRYGAMQNGCPGEIKREHGLRRGSTFYGTSFIAYYWEAFTRECLAIEVNHLLFGIDNDSIIRQSERRA